MEPQPLAASERPEIAALCRERLLFEKSALLAPQSELGYRYDLANFSGWCERMEMQALPATAETVSLYVTDLLTQGKKVTGVSRRTAGIAHAHRIRGFADPVTEQIRALLRGAKRLRAEQPRQMKPLSVPQLHAICTELSKDGGPVAIRDRAVLVIGFASALRRSNLVDLVMSDIEIEDRGLILHVRKEKQDQERRGRLIALPKGKHVATCPARALLDWLKIRGWAAGPVFPRLDPKAANELWPMSGESMRRVVKRTVVRIGLDPATGFSSHSLRAGFITAAAEAGCGELLIADQTGHRSMAVLRRYFRRSELFRSNASAQLGL
jgi:integrase